MQLFTLVTAGKAALITLALGGAIYTFSRWVKRQNSDFFSFDESEEGGEWSDSD